MKLLSCRLVAFGWLLSSGNVLPIQSLQSSAALSSRSPARYVGTVATVCEPRVQPAHTNQQSEAKCRGPCENPFDDENDDMDRREALFALAGTLWAVGVLPDPAFARAGMDANIQLPNPLEQMADRATKQCLVESLGNRECLVYMDEANKLYKGTDSNLLLSRVEASAQAFAIVPSYIEAKKWSQVLGVLTGPMGELVRTMGQLADASDNSAAAKKKIAKFKTDMYAIAAAVDKRNGALALTSHAAATASLVDFVKSL